MMRWWDNEIFVRKRSSSEDALLKLRTQLIKETDERIANESSGKRKYHFRVEAETDRLERLAVTGGCTGLGMWDPRHIVLMNREGDTNIWSKDVLLPLLTDGYVFYRYVVVTDTDYAEENPKRNEGGTVVSVRRWEATQKFRRVEPIKSLFQGTAAFRKEYLNLSHAQIQEMRRENEVKQPVEKFGTFRKDTKICKGWLTKDTALHLKLSKGDMKFFNGKYKHQPVYLKLRALRVMSSNAGDDDFCEDPDDGWPVVDVSVLNTDSSQFHRQPKYGTRICGNENIIFEIFHGNSKTLGFVIEYYVYKRNHLSPESKPDIPLHVAFSVLHPCTMPAHEGQIKTDICSIKGPTVGEIKFRYIFIKSAQPLRFKFFLSLMYAWKKLWKAQEHIVTCSEVRDNSLHFIEETAKNFDFVEISLRNTNDNIPIFAHNSYLVVSIKNPTDYTPLEQYQVPVDKLTLHQLHRMQRLPVRECGNYLKTYDGGVAKPDHNHQPFPTLMQLLNGVKKTVGFIIELKTIRCYENGTYPDFHGEDIDAFVNNVLKTLQQSAGKRPIVLATFHPDVCSVLKLKQNVYPIIFLYDAILDKYPPYDKDFRCDNLDNAISFAEAMHLQGLGINIDTLLKDDNALKIKQHNLVVYCTEQPRDAGAAQKRLNECNLNGIVCTRADAYGPMKRPLRYVLEPKAREREWLKGWAADVETDGFEKPEIPPLEIPNYHIEEYYTKRNVQHIPAGLQQFPDDNPRE